MLRLYDLDGVIANVPLSKGDVRVEIKPRDNQHYLSMIVDNGLFLTKHSSFLRSSGPLRKIPCGKLTSRGGDPLRVAYLTRENGSFSNKLKKRYDSLLHAEERWSAATLLNGFFGVKRSFDHMVEEGTSDIDRNRGIRIFNGVPRDHNLVDLFENRCYDTTHRYLELLSGENLIENMKGQIRHRVGLLVNGALTGIFIRNSMVVVFYCDRFCPVHWPLGSYDGFGEYDFADIYIDTSKQLNELNFDYDSAWSWYLNL